MSPLCVSKGVHLPLRCSGPVGCESGPDRWGFLSPASFPARWGGRAPSAPDRARSPAEPPSWEGWRPAGWGVRGTGAPLWLWDRCCCYQERERKHRKRRWLNISTKNKLATKKDRWIWFKSSAYVGKLVTHQHFSLWKPLFCELSANPAYLTNDVVQTVDTRHQKLKCQNTKPGRQ